MTTTYLELVSERATGRVTEQICREIGGLVSEGGLIAEPAQLRTYECDGLTGFRVAPALVVLPVSTEEVAAVVRVCARERIAFVARGAGTGLSGGALPVADGIVIGLARMRDILSVDAENQRAVVQPGVTNLGISEAVAAHNLYYAPDPSSQVVCTIGGNVAENSGGAHCLKYGFTTNHVLGLTMVCADGSVVTLGGDSLDQVGPDLRALVVGSEGTVGIVTEITVRLLRKPEAIRTLVADFPDAEHAGNAVSDIVSAGIIPAAVEMLDALAIEACEKATGAGYSLDTPAALVVELDGVGVEVEAEFERVQRICRDNQATHIRIAQDPVERALIWKGRKAAFAAMGRISPDYFVQDGVIPRTKLGATLTRIGEMSRAAGLRVANVFHAGDGNMHPLILFDANRPGELERAEAIGGKILELCVAVGGSITGEHGVGREKINQMCAQFNSDEITLFHAVKAAFDPQGLLNPGKNIPTLHRCAEFGAMHVHHGQLPFPDLERF